VVESTTLRGGLSVGGGAGVGVGVSITLRGGLPVGGEVVMLARHCRLWWRCRCQ
jgi:hypothetical protein